MKTVCKENTCTGCMACIEKCKKGAITIQDSLTAYNAVIDLRKCVNCGACELVCPNHKPVQLHSPMRWYEGWAETSIRMCSSSGGAAFAMMRCFVEQGGYVASCCFINGVFSFDITNNTEDLVRFVGSKYVKSNPIGIYTKVVERIKSGDRVLFIGLPCQVAALKNISSVLPAEKRENLYTIDLICHGTPSPQILSQALSESGVDIKKLTDIRFRNKTCFGLSSQKETDVYESLTPAGVQDMYTYAFLTSLDYTDNCYSCRYAALDRVADVTIGDSWGTDLPDADKAKGISLLLCQTDKGFDLIQKAGIQLKEVDIENAVNSNQQLKRPSHAPKEREVFFSNFEKGFNKAVSRAYPRIYYRRKVKGFLVKMKLLRGGGS